ncbi:MAG: hypothetical protein AAF654_14855 [Myxococcota bacterium]
MMRALVLVVLTSCGMNFGSGGAVRRAFPNPPTIGALANAPEFASPASPASPAACSLANSRVEPVDVEATSPWGIETTSSERHRMFLRDIGTESGLVAEIEQTLRGCPKGGDVRLRIVLERVEINAFRDVSPAFRTARVVLRRELFSADFVNFESTRFDGAVRAPIDGASFGDMLVAATRSALSGAIQ